MMKSASELSQIPPPESFDALSNEVLEVPMIFFDHCVNMRRYIKFQALIGLQSAAIKT